MTIIWASICRLILLALIMQPALSESWPDCKFQCQANDVTVSRLWLGDDRGNDLFSAAPGEKQSCYIWATFYNNANSPRYAAILLADLYLNGTLSRSFYDEGLCVLDKIEAKSTVSHPLYDMIWTRGDEFRLKRLVLSWETAKGTSCSQANRKCSNRNTKCYGSKETEFLVEMPLSVFFAIGREDCSLTASFFDRTTGGFGPYVYDWDFGDKFHSQEKNPTHTYEIPGNYTVRLLARDQSGKEASASQQLVVNVCPCTIVGQEHACLGKTETYQVAMISSIPGSIQWHLDGSDILSREEGSIDIDWSDFGQGRHDLQAYATDANAEKGPKKWVACNMTIIVTPEPEAIIRMVA